MTFEESEVCAEPQRSRSYICLEEYCSSDYWKEEAERFSSKRKSLEVDEKTGLEKEAKHQDLLSDSWIDCHDSTDSGGEELEALEDAYRAMSKLTAEYLMVEKAAAKYSRYPQPTLCKGPLPILVPGLSRKQQRSAEGASACSGQDTYIPKPNFMCTVFKESTAVCREWLLEHYENRDGVSIPRSAMYSHYLDFCTEQTLEPLNPAGFGKAVRSVFVHVQTRRLGNRGASKYHYYGLSIKDSSPYSSIVQGTQRVNHLNDYEVPITPNFHPRTVRLSADGSKIVLEGFPSVLSVPLPAALKDKVREFLAKYRCHAEHLVELVVHTNFAEVKDRLVMFWRALPGHIKDTLTQERVVNIIHLCDLAIYKSLAGMLIPSISENLPSNLLSAVRELTENLVTWTQEATSGLPALLQTAKLSAAHAFRHQMARQCVLCHLIQGVKVTLRDQELMRQMLCDWLALDLRQVVRDVKERIGCQQREGQLTYHVQKCVREFERLLSHRSPLDKFFMLVNNVLHSCSSLYIEEEGSSLDTAVTRVLLNWNVGISVVLKELTNKATSTFGSFHLLGMLLTDYMMYLVEDRRRALKEVKLKDKVYSALKTKGSARSPMELALSDFKPIAPKRSCESPSMPVGNSSSESMTSGFVAAVPISLDCVSDAELSGIISQLSSKESLTSKDSRNSSCSDLSGQNTLQWQSGLAAEKLQNNSVKFFSNHLDNKKKCTAWKNIDGNASGASWDGMQPSCSKPWNTSQVCEIDVNELESPRNLKMVGSDEIESGVTSRVVQESLENQNLVQIKSEPGLEGVQNIRDEQKKGCIKQLSGATNSLLSLRKRKGHNLGIALNIDGNMERVIKVLQVSSENRFNPAHRKTSANQTGSWELKKEIVDDFLVLDRNDNIVNSTNMEKAEKSKLATQNNRGSHSHVIDAKNEIYLLNNMDDEPAIVKLEELEMATHSDLVSEEVYLGQGFNAFKEEILQERDSLQKISQVCVQGDAMGD